MAEQMTLSVEKRTTNNKGQNRRLRLEGLVPGIFYDSTGTTVPVQVKELPLSKLLSKVGTAHIFDLDIQGGEKRTSLVKEIVHHPVKRQILHVDFYGVDMNKDIKVSIPVEITGKSKGVVIGGKLEVYRDSLEIVCLPANVPDKIVLDITDLEIGDSIHIQAIALPEGVKAVYEDNFAVVGIEAPEAEPEPGEKAS